MEQPARPTRPRPPGERLVDWADGRLPLYEAARAALRKAFPNHWSFLLGELALYSFVVLVLTGVFLTFFFDPSMEPSVYEGSYRPLQGVVMSQAYATTLELSFDVRGGLLARQIHHWAALLFLASIAAHLLRVFVTGAFRRPRELNWVVGVTMFLLAMVEGFAGYSLPDDLLSGTGLRTAQGIMLSVPIVGTYLSFLVFGGQFPGDDIVPRLYAVHILLVPALLVALIAVHLALIVYLKHTQWAGRGRTARNSVGEPVLPRYLAKSGALFFLVFAILAVLGAIAQINPVWAYGPYRADQVSTGSQPDWYVGFLEGALRLMPGVETRLWGHTLSWNPLLPGVVLPGLLFLVLYAYPFFERWITPGTGERHLCDRPRDRPVRTGLCTGGVAAYAVLLLAGAQDVIAFVFDVPVHALTWTLRVGLVVLPLLAFWLARRLCLGLQEREGRRLVSGDGTGGVRQSADGGYHPEHRSVPPEQRYAALVRELPAPLPAPDSLPAERPWQRWTRRLRRGLSTWYYGDAAGRIAPQEERERVLVGPTRHDGRE
ncbi:ubiquinol-cytochrome c reductase cytochrome b subunit [Streptomyces sp. NPDC047315]|uniref:cytochrome bc1 complex cytochrome b subunit n=1 Tax=Streptomyces sp. NPDC047315 TaxID=3155142 RepID=UPI0033C6ABC3